MSEPMTEQEKREKVIERLLVQIHRIEHIQMEVATNGTAMFPHIEVEALYDALDLLKAQEPRKIKARTIEEHESSWDPRKDGRHGRRRWRPNGDSKEAI